MLRLLSGFRNNFIGDNDIPIHQSLNVKKLIVLFTLIFPLFTVSLGVNYQISNFSNWYLIIVFLSLFPTLLLKSSYERYLYLITLTIGSIAIALFYYFSLFEYGYPYYQGGSDDLEYERNANILVNHQDWIYYDSKFIGGSIGNPFHNSKGFIYFIALISNLIGEPISHSSTIILRYLNVIFLALSGLLIFRIFKTHVNKEVNLFISLLIFICFPTVLYITSYVFRDILVLFLILLAVQLTSSRSVSALSKAIASISILLILSQLRISFVPLVLIVVLFTVISQKKIYNKKHFKLLAGSLSLMALIFTGYIFQQQVTMLLEAVSRYTEYVSNLSDGFAKKIFSSHLMIQPFLRIMYSIAYPVPSFSTDIIKSTVSIGTLLQVIIMPPALITVINSLKNDRLHYLVFAFIALYFTFAFGTFTFRHQLYYLPFVFGFFAISLQYFHKLYIKITFLVSVLLSSFLLVFAVLR